MITHSVQNYKNPHLLDMRQIAEKIRQTSLSGMESEERMRESSELIRADQVHKLLEEARQSINNLYQETTKQLKEMRKISKSAKAMFHVTQGMLQKVSEQMEKARL